MMGLVPCEDGEWKTKDGRQGLDPIDCKRINLNPKAGEGASVQVMSELMNLKASCCTGNGPEEPIRRQGR